MNKVKVVKYNQFVYGAYRADSFTGLLRYVIMGLHELVMYESGMFFCGISQDCSFFKPYIRSDGKRDMEDYYHKQEFPVMEEYLKAKRADGAGKKRSCVPRLGIQTGYCGDDH